MYMYVCILETDILSCKDHSFSLYNTCNYFSQFKSFLFLCRIVNIILHIIFFVFNNFSSSICQENSKKRKKNYFKWPWCKNKTYSLLFSFYKSKVEIMDRRPFATHSDKFLWAFSAFLFFVTFCFCYCFFLWKFSFYAISKQHSIECKNILQGNTKTQLF